MRTTKKFDDRAMMLDSDNWPCWPFLPVKRGDALLENDNIGVVVENDGTWTVYLANMFAMNLHAAKKLVYETVDALLADGWVVD